MRFDCRVTRTAVRLWAVRYEGTDFGPVEVTAPTREEALEKMRRELHYRLELCPCTGQIYQDVEIELRER